MNFRSIAIHIFQILTQCLDFLIPKDSRIVLFGSYGGRYPGGNAKPVFDYLTSLPNSPLKCYYFLKEKIDDKGYIGMNPLTIKTYFLFLRAKTIVTTHSLWDYWILKPSRRKNWIRLWHGHSGPKADGWPSKRFTAENRMDIERTSRLVTKFLVTSRINLYFWAYALLLHPNQMMPFGFPRNDFLLKPPPVETKLKKILPDLPKDCKVILYAPTYRLYAETKFFPFDDFNRQDLEKWMLQQNIVILLRYHMGEEKPIEESERVISFGSGLCKEINEVLHEVDLLITDYSSISSDYLLLDKPIVYAAFDRDLFERYEGFCFGNYDYWTPGPKVYTYAEFKKEIENALSGKDRYVDERHRINALINEYQTIDSTKRVAEFLIKFLTNPDKNNYDAPNI